MAFLKRMFWWGVLAAVGYALMGYHFIIIDKKMKLLKKSKYTLEYTFFSTAGKGIKTVLDVDVLREDGIADLLVEMGKLTEEKKEILMAQYNGDSN